MMRDAKRPVDAKEEEEEKKKKKRQEQEGEVCDHCSLWKNDFVAGVDDDSLDGKVEVPKQGGVEVAEACPTMTKKTLIPRIICWRRCCYWSPSLERRHNHGVAPLWTKKFNIDS